LHRTIDDTFPIGKNKGTILAVVVAYGNNQSLPLAIAFAEGENGDSWYCVLRERMVIVGIAF
jgi:hypothetical protein